MRWVSALATIAIFSSSSAPAVAVEFFENRGGWDIVGGDDFCATAMEFEGPGATKLYFWKQSGGQLRLVIDNMNWSAEKDQEYDIALVLNERIYSGASAIGVRTALRRGFIVQLEDAFEADFVAGSGLEIYLNDTLIDSLSLAGTASAVTSLNRCHRKLRAELAAEARERARWEHLPKDPFASPPVAPPPREAAEDESVKADEIDGRTDAEMRSLFEAWRKSEGGD